MHAADTLAHLGAEARQELTEHILPYWLTRTPDEARGGFIGRITGADVPEPEAPKGVVLNARLLWTFAAAAREMGDEGTRAAADRAYTYLRDHFADREHGGVFWMLHADGQPLDTKKQVYAQAFTIYALAEYVRLTGSEEARDWAVELFDTLEQHAADPEHGGYFEAFSREWGALDDVRLSEKDEDAPKSMNTLLHVMEAYANLYRIWPDTHLAERLAALIEIFLDRVIDAEANHQRCFFAADWTPTSGMVSYGHDIETSWLLVEAAEVLDRPDLLARAREAGVGLAHATLTEGVDTDGGLFNEALDGHLDTDKHWWPQAEAVVGFLNAYQITEEGDFLEAAAATWDYLQRDIIDREGGEWYFRVSRTGEPYRQEDKVGPWKCPYHNARACLEIMHRVELLADPHVHDAAENLSTASGSKS